ncbi:MAG: hypothetical protein GF364_09075 [Candidatus Lokiarchaeota archaeon]|nr:hypothetical protein [Candidatus Lokiarchaeota archaeon]
MPVSIAELGNSLRCPEDDCDKFGKIMKMKVSEKKVTIELVCEQHLKKYMRKYSINQFARLCNSALIDDEWVIAFQKHIMVQKGQFIKLRNGLDGAFYTKNKKVIRSEGSKLICKCGSFYSVTFVKAKKDKVRINLYCAECTPKGKKEWIKAKDLMELVKAGLVDSTLGQKVKDVFSDDTEVFDTSESYSASKGILAGWVQEDLGMMDEGGGVKKCYICGARVSDAMDRCPKCGSDL